MKPVAPILVIDELSQLHDELMALLRSLSQDDWRRPTSSGAWTVKDVVAHLLDGDLRRLSFQRDKLPLPQPEKRIANNRDLVAFLNQMNAEWIRAARRLSPAVLLELLQLTGPAVIKLFRNLDPEAPAMFAVAWAGDESSPNWFDIAREYTEKWHHQQQIREAIGAAGLTQRKWLFPLLDTFLRALPHAYRDTNAEPGAQISVVVTGDSAGQWTLSRDKNRWRLYSGHNPNIRNRVRLDDATAWRLLTRRIDAEEAASHAGISGDPALAQPFFNLVALMV